MINKSCKILILISALFLGVFNGFAQTSKSAKVENTKEPSIIDHINESDHHEIVAPSDILNILIPSESIVTPNEKGKAGAPVQKGARMRTIYRVQVLSVNQSGNGRAMAEKSRRAVSSRFSQYPCDLAFEAPNWKVRVGIFENQNDANAAAAKIRQSLPQYAKEVRVVRVNMKVTK